MSLERDLKATLERRLSTPPERSLHWDHVERNIRVSRRTRLVSGALATFVLILGAFFVVPKLTRQSGIAPADAGAGRPMVQTALLKAIKVGSEPRGIAINDHTNHIYVGDRTDQTVTVIDAIADTVTATINIPGHNQFPLESQFKELVATYAGNHVFVAAHDGVYRIDGANNRVTGPLAGYPIGRVAMAVDQDLALLYLTAGKEVVVVDAWTSAIVRRYPIPVSAWDIAVDQSMHRIFVAADNGSGRLVVLDGRTGTVIGNPKFDFMMGPMTVDDSTHNLYVGFLDRIQGLNGKTLRPLKTMEGEASALGVDTRNHLLLATSDTGPGNKGEGVLSVIYPPTQSKVATLNLPSQAEHHGDGVVSESGIAAVSYNAGNSRIYATSPRTGEVFVAQARSGAIPVRGEEWRAGSVPGYAVFITQYPKKSPCLRIESVNGAGGASRTCYSVKRSQILGNFAFVGTGVITGQVATTVARIEIRFFGGKALTLVPLRVRGGSFYFSRAPNYDVTELIAYNADGKLLAHQTCRPHGYGCL